LDARAIIADVGWSKWDMSMDGSPFIDKTSIDGAVFNAGWCLTAASKAHASIRLCYAAPSFATKPNRISTAAAYQLDRLSARWSDRRARR